jgi:ribose-phosphate pyrophosphokinase
VDDICSTGGTLKRASLVCKAKGGKAIRAFVTHGIFVKAFEESAIEKMFVTNTIPFPKGLPKKIRTVSVAPLFAKAIQAIAGAKSISSLFQ